jgi:hypothetical protein
MAVRGYKPEQIVNLLRQIEVGIANGMRPRKEAEITAERNLSAYLTALTSCVGS